MAKVTIVTIVKNDSRGLEKSILSVLSQSFQDWELLLVVAPSKDSSRKVAEKFSSSDIRIKYILDSKSGIYQAMNQGLEVVESDFCWFLNAGDQFASNDVLADAVEILLSTKKAVVIGSHNVDSLDTAKLSSNRCVNYTPLEFAFNRKHGNHQAMLYRTLALKNLGGYRLDYELASDFDVTLRIILKFGGVKRSKVYSVIESGGIADVNLFKVHSEKHHVRRNAFDSHFVTFLSIVWTMLARLKVVTKKS